MLNESTDLLHILYYTLLSLTTIRCIGLPSLQVIMTQSSFVQHYIHHCALSTRLFFCSCITYLSKYLPSDQLSYHINSAGIYHAVFPLVCEFLLLISVSVSLILTLQKSIVRSVLKLHFYFIKIRFNKICSLCRDIMYSNKY